MAHLFTTAENREIFYDYTEGKGIPIVFLNGLSDSYSEWKAVVSLTQLKRPILLVDLIGQGRSLEKEFSDSSSSLKKFNYRISIEEQGQALVDLCQSLKMDRFSVVGFSYGGGLALWVAQQHPEKIQDLVLFLPFLLRLDLAFPMSRVLHFQYDLLKKMTPSFFQAPYQLIEKSYEHFVHDYMHFRFADRIKDKMYREAAVQISEGIMHFNVFQILNQMPDKSVHLVSCDLDTLIPKSLMQEFWTRLPQSKKLSWTRVEDGEHLLLEQNPAFSAALLQSLLGFNQHSDVVEVKVKTQSFSAEKNHFSA